MSKPMEYEHLFLAAVQNGEMEIDEFGQIWRVKKWTGDRWKGGRRLTKCRRMRADIILGKGGYLRLSMMMNGKTFRMSAHRLVYMVKKGPIPEGLTVNHKDGIKSHNRPKNLELATHAEQRAHALKVLKVKPLGTPGEKHPRCQTTAATVLEIRRLRKEGVAINVLATTFNLTPNSVSCMTTRKSWKHLP